MSVSSAPSYLGRVSFAWLVFGLLAAGSSAALARSLDEVKLKPEVMAPQCAPIDGQFAVSIQAHTLFEMLEPGPQALFPPPARKVYQSFDCAGAKSTIYYYEFASEQEQKTAVGFTKGFVWGEDGPSTMHPEYIIPVENLIIVISSRDPHYFANAFVYGIPGKLGDEFGQGMEAYGKQDYAKAEEKFRALARSSPNLTAAQLYLGHSLFFQDKFKDAIAPYERARDLAAKSGALSPVHRRVLTDQLGMAYGLTGRMKDAQALFESAIRSDPEFPMYYYNLACAQAEQGDLEAAIENLKAGYARRSHMLPGETFPDPRADDSFKKYLGEPKFAAALREMGY